MLRRRLLKSNDGSRKIPCSLLCFAQPMIQYKRLRIYRKRALKCVYNDLIISANLMHTLRIVQPNQPITRIFDCW